VFQNPDDLRTFANDGLVVPNRTILIKGSGVNVHTFAPRPGQPNDAPVPIVLFAARVNGDKGVYEFVETARRLREKGVEATFQIAGNPDSGNPTAVPASTLEHWRTEGAVDLLGHVDGIEEIMSQATIVVLPTHGGEGVPRVLLEAASMGKPIVATDVPGCREAVVEGENGYLVPAKDIDTLADAVERLLRDKAMRQKMGEYGRAKMIEEFDDQDVAQRTALIYQSMGVFSPGQLERSYSR
jgi:glycosyltransferase involved in cell wall biosynthesis